MAVVKASSYGSGKNEIVNLLQYHKVDYLAVAYLDEGVEVDSAIHRHEIPANFGDKALEESAKLPKKVLTKDKKGKLITN